ncbi:MAG: hypothetical protein OCD76_01795 [Reichenbachiella sp.]
MVKAIKFCYLISVPVFLVVLLYYYALLPESVGVHYSQTGLVLRSISKADFFYSALGVFVITNLLIYVYRYLKKGVAVEEHIDFSQMNRAESIYHWFNGLSLMFNIFYILSVVFIGLYNSREHFDVSNYALLVYIGPFLIVSWFFWFLFLRFSKT